MASFDENRQNKRRNRRPSPLNLLRVDQSERRETQYGKPNVEIKSRRECQENSRCMISCIHLGRIFVNCFSWLFQVSSAILSTCSYKNPCGEFILMLYYSSWITVHIKILEASDSSKVMYFRQNYYGDAGLDLIHLSSFSLPPSSDLCIPLRYVIRVYLGPFRVPFLVSPRSSLRHSRLHSDSAAGLCDSGYEGEVKLTYWNITSEVININQGVALMQIVPISSCTIASIKIFDVNGKCIKTSIPQQFRESSSHGSTGNLIDNHNDVFKPMNF